MTYTPGQNEVRKAVFGCSGSRNNINEGLGFQYFFF